MTTMTSHLLRFVPLPTVAAFLVAIFVAGCKDKPAETTAGPATAPAPVTGPHGSVIIAEPNPVAPGDGMGSTTVKWTTGDGSWGEVYLSTSGQPESLFSAGPLGTKSAGWIANKGKYTFLLYAGKDHKDVLSTVTVTR